MNSCSIIIPTLERGAILLQTLSALLDASPRASEIIVADQTRTHPAPVRDALEAYHRRGEIHWLRLSEPSIPRSMNAALLEASGDCILFLDDDIIPNRHLIERHLKAYTRDDIWAVQGQVLQPGQEPVAERREYEAKSFLAFLDFPFHSMDGCFIENAMAGNLSVRRARALQVGGFDEHFIGAAYRFETDFARRITQAGGRIWFEPQATIRHLQHPTGGVRAHGHHLRAHTPSHTAGDYYFALLHAQPRERRRYLLRRLVRSIGTRYHLTHPWWIPSKLLAELRGYVCARRFAREGRRLLSSR